jgi:hypothetical protein
MWSRIIEIFTLSVPPITILPGHSASINVVGAGNAVAEGAGMPVLIDTAVAVAVLVAVLVGVAGIVVLDGTAVVVAKTVGDGVSCALAVA